LAGPAGFSAGEDERVSTIDRRAFLGAAGAGLAGIMLGGALPGCGGGSGGGAGAGSASGAASGAGGAQGAISLGAASGAALSRNTPGSVGIASDLELDVDLNVISGRLPTDLLGHAFTIAPVPERDGTFVFSGDGVVYRFDFGASKVGLKSRLMKTPCWYADKATRGTAAGFKNLNFGPARSSFDLGARNQANTAFAPMGNDRLLVTYDAGRPFEIDPVSLEVATAVGWNSEWRPGLKIPAALRGMVMGSVFPMTQTSAHPYYDPFTREMFLLNFGGNQGINIFGANLLAETFTDLMSWDGAGAMKRWTLVDEQGRLVKIIQSAHQMQATADYVLVMDCAFYLEAEKIFSGERMKAQLPDTVIWLVKRADLARTASGGRVTARKVVIPKEGIHFVADYDNPGGRISLEVCHNCAADPSEWLLSTDRLWHDGAAVRPELLGMIPTATDIGWIGQHVIDGPNARWVAGESRYMKDDKLTWGAAFYTHQGTYAPGRFTDLYWTSAGFSADLLATRVVRAYETYKHRTVPISALPIGEGRPTAVFRTNRAAGAIVDAWQFPEGRMGLSPTFVPRAGGRGDATDGYIVITVISDDRSWAGSSGDELWVFDATDLAKGPLCRLGHPQLDMPFTLHTTWLPEIRPRTAAYKVDVRQDHAAEVAKLEPRLRTLFETSVYPHF